MAEVFKVESVDQRVREIIAGEMEMNVTEITNQSKLTDLGIDSLDEVEIAIALDKEFGMITDQMERLPDVQAVIDFVMKHKGR